MISDMEDHLADVNHTGMKNYHKIEHYWKKVKSENWFVKAWSYDLIWKIMERNPSGETVIKASPKRDNRTEDESESKGV